MSAALTGFALLVLFLGKATTAVWATSVESTAEEINSVDSNYEAMQRDRRGYPKCYNGFSEVPGTRHCYRVVFHKLKFQDAMNSCHLYDSSAYLVNYDSIGEFEDVAKYLTATYEGTQALFWIGGAMVKQTCAGPWSWYTHYNTYPVREFHWCPKQPDCLSNNEFNLHIEPHNGGYCMNDNNGATPLGFICEY